MNCKPNDIARLVKTPAGRNHNRLVSVDGTCGDPTCDRDRLEYGHLWRCTALQSMDTGDGTDPPGSLCCIPDQFLRPLHDGDGQDEALRVAGLPEQRETPLECIKALPAELI